MSRVGKKPVSIVSGVKVSLDGKLITVEGPKGKLTFEHRSEVEVKVDDGQVTVSRFNDDRESRSFHGLTRAVIQNMIVGVTQGYEKKLDIVGVGYVASVQNGEIQMRVGFANELVRKIPEGLTVVCPDTTHVTITGCDKQQVSQFAAELRSLRKPEPYKGKGIRYSGEQVKLKAGKASAK
ncbi:50S ribosomal protein L6 [Rosistilla carotiformis]|uniref:Large ribosomal subunit protein uL6 n=1 Tax=Rosistilla carotiformis TaxID=2528017 RepID=A0A518JZI4_9BACT|nr:50S ribosomal protein L6 [Rosistilla carotiformis]QDV70958.1 50S ribosomal protein L6 [Rosistilla carotiformis]